MTNPQQEASVTQKAEFGARTEPGGELTPVKKEPISPEAWREWLDPILDFLSKLPDEIGSFFSDYKKPLLTVGLFVSGAVTVYVTLAVLDAINDIPLLAPLLELVGLGYSGWFVYRYLLRASNRRELVAEFNSLKTQVVGQNGEQR
ncbi:MAG: CAAD domain-containing protein [Chroococcales cyanobacterium]